MKPEKEKIVLFSGRFDPVHASHVITIQRLANKYRKVIVVILDHREQYFPVGYRHQCMREILDNSRGYYDLHVNKTHFGEITAEEIGKHQFDVYASGNMDVLKHVESLGYECLYVERAYEDHAEYIRVGKKLKEMLK